MAAMGVLGLALVQGVFIYGGGIRIVVPASQICALSGPAAKQLRQEWPQVRNTVENTLQPLLRDQVRRMVGAITVDIGGVPISLPISLQSQVARQVDRLLVAHLTGYFKAGFNPSQILTPGIIHDALTRPVLMHVWVQMDGIPMPVCVRLGGR